MIVKNRIYDLLKEMEGDLPNDLLQRIFRKVRRTPRITFFSIYIDSDNQKIIAHINNDKGYWIFHYPENKSQSGEWLPF